MSETKLKPCPFCGNEEIKLHNLYSRLDGKYMNCVKCSKCRCNSGEWKIEEDAIEAWNRRATE